MSEAPTADELIRSFYEISKATDMAYVIVTATILEDHLEQGLLGRMRDLSSVVYKRMFAGGPLSSFSAKIDLAFALNMIDETARKDFHAIRELRNAFAHAKSIVHFASQELQLPVQKLSGWEKGADVKRLFDKRVAALMAILLKSVETSISVAALKGDASLE
jgi:DNA-binding MltR family transcriptional regulator